MKKNVVIGVITFVLGFAAGGGCYLAAEHYCSANGKIGVYWTLRDLVDPPAFSRECPAGYNCTFELDGTMIGEREVTPTNAQLFDAPLPTDLAPFEGETKAENEARIWQWKEATKNDQAPHPVDAIDLEEQKALRRARQAEQKKRDPHYPPCACFIDGQGKVECSDRFGTETKESAPFPIFPKGTRIREVVNADGTYSLEAAPCTPEEPCGTVTVEKIDDCRSCDGCPTRRLELVD